MDFLAGHSVQFSNSGVIYQDAQNGLDLDLLMTSFELSRKDLSTPVILEGVGSLNGEKLTLNGNFPQKQPFTVSADFSQISVKLDGTPDPAGYDVGFAVAVSMDIAELGQLLNVFKLEKSLTGTGHVKAVFKNSAGVASIGDLDVFISLDGGQSLKLTGDLGKLGDPTDMTLDTRIRLYPKDKEPAPVKEMRKLKLIAVDMKIAAQPDGPPHRQMVIQTNGFVLDTSGVGPPPISFSDISRTPKGLLRVGKLVLRIGPPDANFLVLEGSITDALKLEGIDIDGTLALPVASLIAPTLLQASEVLGHISGGFQLIGNTEELSLSNLNATAQGTDLWTLNVSGSIRNVLNFSNVSLDITADVPSGAKMLSALDLEPIKTGHVKLSTNLSSNGTDWKSKATIAVGESKVHFNLDLNLGDPQPIVRGQIESDLINVDQINDIVAAALQLEKLNKLDKSAAKSKLDQTDTNPPETADGNTPVEVNDRQSSGPFRNVTLVPLGRAILLSGMDLNVTIDLRKIEGERDSTSLQTDLVMKNGKASFGPMKLEYDGAHFNINGSLDLNEDPGNLKLSGSTGGWNFSKIMRALRFKKSASGVMSADFDIAGSYASVKGFLSTMNGAATVSMRNGSIDSQLLNVAGLGVVPWLFTTKKGPAVTIVCIRAPFYISKGSISTKKTVVETDRVQIVVAGDVNMRNKTMNIVGQPRRIGKPLSRSPWPFTVVGPFAKPKVKIKDGSRRLRRQDGATTMPKRRKLCVPDILQLK
ncbi:MAG: AsmA family protein [Rhodobacteraceae bacterium]|nr:AsmA family protein [Paracoccaceae bacterium]